MLVSKRPRRPNVSRWNIGRIGFPGIGAPIGHVHFLNVNPASNGRWAFTTDSEVILLLKT